MSIFETDKLVAELQQKEPSNIGSIQNFKLISVGSGNQRFQVSDEGVFLGAETFADAPFSVDMAGSIKANAGTFSGTISGATITGSTVQTAATGYRSLLNSSNGFQLYNGATFQGSMRADSAASMILNSVGNVYIQQNSNQMAHFTANSVDFPSGYRLTWAGGRDILNTGSGFECDGDWNPDADEGQNLGDPNKKWNNVYAQVLWQQTNTNGSRQVYDFAYIEMNLLPKRLLNKRNKGIQMANGYVPGISLPFKKGTVLKWSSKKLKESTKSSDFSVAIADDNGLPIVLGAEPVRVIGKAKIGDFVVSSDTKGCAKAIGAGDVLPSHSVIGRCLENKKTPKEGLIMVMINF